ncbi:hypothetical protein DFH06DRAFT_1477338 [Mycena polygramma]|nr:hypothetical protein DFH06DRAFT_1477338 [Mycena polygramma]
MRLISAVHVSAALLWTVYAVPMPIGTTTPAKSLDAARDNSMSSAEASADSFATLTYQAILDPDAESTVDDSNPQDPKGGCVIA